MASLLRSEDPVSGSYFSLIINGVGRMCKFADTVHYGAYPQGLHRLTKEVLRDICELKKAEK